MSNISAQLVKELRERSGAGMMECKKALVENNADIESAMEWLRKSGLAKADKKASRIAAEGRIVAAQSAGKAVLVEINCETDFVGKDESFLKFSDTVADVALNSGAADIDALKAAAYPGASNVEEAILWHEGQGAEARSRFMTLDATSRRQLLAWIESL